MAGMNFQFHAEPHELLFELLPKWLEGHPVFLAAENFSRETRRHVVEGSDLRSAEEDLGTIYRVFVRLSPFANKNGSRIEFSDSNPDMFTVHPGRLNVDGLRESSVGAYLEDPPSFAAMRNVIARAKKSMNKGAITVGPLGHRGESKHHRFSEGALALYQQGVPMLGIAGGTRYEFMIPVQDPAD